LTLCLAHSATCGWDTGVEPEAYTCVAQAVRLAVRADEFGLWVLHFDATGVLLEPPFPVPGSLVQPTVPGSLMSPNNPFLVPPDTATQPNSRGFEAMSSTPDGRYLYPILEGATVADSDTLRRFLFEFSIDAGEFTGHVWQYRTEQPGFLIADMWALDEHRMVVIERDGGRGPTAVFRNVYVVDLRDVGPDGFLVKHQAVDLAAIADPDLISLPPIHVGDVRLGDPFGVACESIEAIHVIDGERILLGCDNNFPNTGRNPSLADDNELIVVKVPGLKSLN
jgi:glycerophosphoryl diester phosphodiesterase